MDKKKSIVVSINGNKKTIRKKRGENRSHYVQPMSLNQQELNQLSEGKSNYFHKQKTNDIPEQNTFQRLKPLFIAIISAIVVGSALGFLMLVMFKGIGGNDPATLGSPVSTNNESEYQEKQDENLKSTTSAQAMSAYVLQSGVFSELDNAKQWGESYVDAGYPVIIWKSDEQYFLFTGISTSKDAGEAYADELLELDFDIFVKEWHTKSREISLSVNEHEWIELFQALWSETLQSVSAGNSLSNKQWNELLDGKELETKALISFREQLKELLIDDQINNNTFNQQHFLLYAWYEFELIMNAI